MLLTGCRLKRLIPSFERRKDIHRNRSIFHLAVFIFTEIQNLIDQAQKDIHIVLSANKCSTGSATNVNGVRKS